MIFEVLNPEWAQGAEAVERRSIPPDPRVLRSLGHNHNLVTALADLVDNSVSAEATQVTIRFVRRNGRPVTLLVIDDGRGMTCDQLDNAMTLGGNREYDPGDLGHFGIGLKAASLGQAQTLTVYSRSDSGESGARRQERDSAYECDVLTQDDAAAMLEACDVAKGTVIRLDGVRIFESFVSQEAASRFLEAVIPDIDHHLGLVFHRFLGKEGSLRLCIDTQETETAETGVRTPIKAIDPFGYPKSLDPSFPKTLRVKADSLQLELACHIWTTRSTLNGYRLNEADPRLRHQGFFVYRNKRLLQAGGWNGAVHPESDYVLARVRLDLPEEAGDLFQMNPEKTKVDFAPRFVTAVLKGQAEDGTTLIGYLDRASEIFTKSKKRKLRERKVVRPGRGFAPVVRKAVDKQFDFTVDSPIDVRWADLEDDEFFDIDLDERVIWLNRRYREAATGDRGTSLNDAPLVKALLYFAVEELFQGERHGSKDKYVVRYLSAVLREAARAEIS